MSPKQATAIVDWMAGLFPGLTPEQCEEWVKSFLPYESDCVREAVRAHHMSRAKLDPPNLLEAIRAEMRRRQAGHAERIDRERREVESKWRNVEDLIRDLSDEDLAELKREAISGLEPTARAWLEKSDPRTSRMLKAIIWTHWKKLASAA